MLKAVKNVITPEAQSSDLEKRSTQRKKSTLSEGVIRKSSANDPAIRKRKPSTKAVSAERVPKKSIDQPKILQKSKTTLIEKPKIITKSKSSPDNQKPKSLLEIKRESIGKVMARKASGAESATAKAPKRKPTAEANKDRSGVNKEIKKTPEVSTEPSRPSISEQYEKLAPFMTAEVHEEKMEMLREIVAQAELDHMLFAIFDNRRYITRPMREELIKRGWEEYQPEKSKIPRKIRSCPTQVATSTPLVDTTAVPINRTELAMLVNGKRMYLSPPAETMEPQRENKEISDYAIIGWERVLAQPLAKKKKTSGYRTPSDLKLISQIIEENEMEVSMVWLSSKPELQLSYFSYTPNIVNKFQKTFFCTKMLSPQLGLWQGLKKKQEIEKYLKFPVQTPRMYNLGDTESYANFLFDFYVTAVTSILRWLVLSVTNEGVSSITDQNGKIPQRVFEYAIKKTKLLIKYLNNDATVTRNEIMRSPTSWRNLLLWFYKLINEQEKLEILSTPALYILHSQAVEVLRALRQINPESANDGITNLWIVKPYSASCGRGIFLTNNLYYLERLNQKRFIIQKYIERPLLISETKFDIRQWFMITSLSPLQIWMYKECYLRFCSAPFSLRNLHESIHLTNNAIQRKYAKTVGLPHQNMWDSFTFQRYLRETGSPNIWEERIYPGMRDALITTLLCSESAFDTSDLHYPPRGGWFEVYGADFMISQNLREGPWLIEINESPALDASSPVTERLCPKMLRDVVKVVIDWRNDPKSDTGEWQLVFSGKFDN